MKKTGNYMCIAMVLLLSCNHKITENKSTTEKNMMPIKPFDYQGHRGCRGLMPENTIPAFLHALQLGVSTLEMDAVINADNEVIISHEPFFNHEIATLPSGRFIEDEKEETQYNIYKMNAEQLTHFDVGLKPHPRFEQQQKMAAHKPFLIDVIDSAEAYAKTHRLPAVQYNIETKTQPKTDDVFHPKPDVFVDILLEVITNKKIIDRVTIQSFDIRTLQYLHRKFPTVKTALLIEDFDRSTLEQQLQQLGFTPTIYSPEQSLVNKTLVLQCHSKGMQVIPWTVNDIEKMKALKGMGVDGLISDYPNLYKQLK